MVSSTCAKSTDPDKNHSHYGILEASGFLVGGFSPTHLKNINSSKWVHLPQIYRGENKKMFELPPPSFVKILAKSRNSTVFFPKLLWSRVSNSPSDVVCSQLRHLRFVQSLGGELGKDPPNPPLTYPPPPK